MKGFTGRILPRWLTVAVCGALGAACQEGQGTRPDARVTSQIPDAAVPDADTRMHSLNVRVLHPTGTATGTISSDPPGINDCADDCTAEFPHGTTIRLSATGGTFGGWAGAGCAGIGSCFKVLADDATVDGVFWNVSFTGINRVFTTSRLYSPGLFGSVDGADAACQAEADGAGYSGTWIAWISSPTSLAMDRLGTASGWVRPDGLPFARSRPDLMSGVILYPPSLDERGFTLVDHFLDHQIVTGTLANGVPDFGAHCSDWTSDAANYQYGDPFGTTRWWTEVGQFPCTKAARLLCLQTDYTMAPVNPTAGGGPWRSAFVTTAMLDASVGVTGFDAQCATEASMAGLTGSYKALVSTSTAPAASRFPNPDAGPPWRRMDGALLATTGGHLFDSPWLTSLNVDAGGTNYLIGFAWTGSGPDLREPAYSTCQDWSSASNGEYGQAGMANAGGPWGSSWFYLQCNNPQRVYCLQE